MYLIGLWRMDGIDDWQVLRVGAYRRRCDKGQE
jgi:hypothetical protein